MDNSSVGGVITYKFSNVTSNHTITAYFAPNTNTTTIMDATTSEQTLVQITLTGNITETQIVTNITITPKQTEQTTIIAFNITGQEDTLGFSNMTITKSAIPYGSTPVVNINGVTAEKQGYTEDENNYYVWYTTSISNQITINIQFTGLAASTQQPVYTNYIIIGGVAALFVAAIAGLVYRKKKDT